MVKISERKILGFLILSFIAFCSTFILVWFITFNDDRKYNEIGLFILYINGLVLFILFVLIKILIVINVIAIGFAIFTKRIVNEIKKNE